MVARYDCSNLRSGRVGSFDVRPPSEDDEEEEEELRLPDDDALESESQDATSSSMSRSVSRRRGFLLLIFDGIVSRSQRWRNER